MPAFAKVCDDFAQGDDFTIKISHNPVPVGGIEGYTFRLIISAIEGGDPILDSSYVVPAGADADNGIANIPIASADTTLVPPGEYFASLKRTTDTGLVRTLLRSGMVTSTGVTVEKVTVHKNLGA